MFNFFQPISCNCPIFCNRNFLKWLSFHFFRNQQLTRHFFSINSKVAYVCLYVYIFFSGLGRYSLVVLVHSGDRPARQGQGRKHFANLQRYFAISKRYFAIFEKIFRNFRKDILQFCKDIPQFSQRYSAIFAE